MLYFGLEESQPSLQKAPLSQGPSCQAPSWGTIISLSLSLSRISVHFGLLEAWVEVPKVEPKFQAPFLGFTRTAEVWNSRACMIGLSETFIVELITNKGIFYVIGVEVGKGLDLPL
ncbi:hypothetical protein EUGRSUZ_K03094 [Eucalyptus grandis]|uniref:Uncharacterized protein n=2 Tax=Eucalyptus grandis TaxID=71139 RepID=A0ACC3IYI8_EUCGR|nr:hypothetical protein EUGRSUZ_K03094 [Eucalyptus grandis]